MVFDFRLFGVGKRVVVDWIRSGGRDARGSLAGVHPYSPGLSTSISMDTASRRGLVSVHRYSPGLSNSILVDTPASGTRVVTRLDQVAATDTRWVHTVLSTLMSLTAQETLSSTLSPVTETHLSRLKAGLTLSQGSGLGLSQRERLGQLLDSIWIRQV